MKALVPVICLLLSGCSLFTKEMTRLVPKIEMHSPPEELMTPPKPLKTIVQPEAAKKDAPKEEPAAK